ncbi:MAG: proliferating cell nuclear antigen (pcna) [Candidatus Micrarchaeaceae archaeon]
MFELKLANAKYWKSCVEAIVNLVDEGSFVINSDGISLKAMDPSSISMVSFNMPKKAFEKFSVDKETTIGLNLENFNKILSRTRDDESLLMKDSNGKLLLEFAGQSGKRRYRLQLIDVRKGVEKEPNVNFEAVSEIFGDPLKEIIKDASLISSYVMFKASKEGLTITAHGDSGELEELHEANGQIIKKLEVSKPAEATFNLEYLENMVKACPIGNTVSMYLKTSEPLKLSYNIGDASVTYYLAPYIES